MGKVLGSVAREEFFRNNYKKLFLVPILLAVISLTIIGLHMSRTGTPVDYDIDFEGGTTATLTYTGDMDIGLVENRLSADLGFPVAVKRLSDYTGTTTAVTFSVDKEADVDALKGAIAQAMGIQFDSEDYSVKTVGPSMGTAFLNQALGAVAIGFILIALVLLYTFKVPEIAAGAVLCGFFNIIAAVAFMNVAGLKLNVGTLAAILMFLAGSVDENILIITRVLEYRKHAVHNALSAIGTGVMLIATSFVAYLVLFFFTNVQLFQDFAAVLIAGTVADALNTWFQNIALVLWYVERKFGKSAL